jgi:PIN domain nuclease of toxin-antitoxin system
VNLLLDTNVFLWANIDPERLGLAANDALIEDDAELLVSAVVALEIAIKYAIGRLELPMPPERFVPEGIRKLAGDPIVIGHREALGVAALPPIHRDPFDRLLVAQAIAYDATLVTGDHRLADYPVQTLLV